MNINIDLHHIIHQHDAAKLQRRSEERRALNVENDTRRGKRARKSR